jgi:hypothetical protein
MICNNESAFPARYSFDLRSSVVVGSSHENGWERELRTDGRVYTSCPTITDIYPLTMIYTPCISHRSSTLIYFLPVFTAPLYPMAYKVLYKGG